MRRTFIRCSAFLTALGLFLGTLGAQQGDDPEFNGRRATEWIRILKSDSSNRKRKAAVVVLGQLWTDGKYRDSITNINWALQNDPSADVRLQAAGILGQITKEELKLREDVKPVVNVLLGVLQSDRDSSVRREAATSLGRYGEFSKPAVGALTVTLKDSEPATQAAAADALGRIGPGAKNAAAELLPMLKSSDVPVRQASIFALGRIAPDDAEAVGVVLAEMLKKESDEALRKELIVSLGLLGARGEPVALALASAMREPNIAMRRLAARSLAGFGPAIGPAVPILLNAFEKDEDKNVRIDALRTLGSGLGQGLREHMSMLISRLNVDADADPKGDPDFEVRIAITDELGALGSAGKDAIPALRRSLRDPQVKVRESAAGAIKKIEKPAVEKK